MSQESEIEQIFLRVVDLAPAERASVLDSLRLDTSEREAVDSLLSWDEDVPDQFLPLSEPPPSTIAEGARIGPYLILNRLGEGGMGTVYAARQSSPDREVALKVLRVGRVSEESTRRFRQEIDVLGRLQHRGIARIYDAGSCELTDPLGAPQDVPYFTMERVRGKSLIAHAREQGLTVSARVELLARVCDAVNYAHQRGVIHRDLKAENVLVTHEESTNSMEDPMNSSDIIGQPKVLDFGIARVIDPAGGQTTRQTVEGALIGTLSSMSPEQVDGGRDLVGVRTDVYALGVMLYELLCQRTPLAIDGMSIPQAILLIQNEIPVAPDALDPSLAGDLTTITMKALEKDPERRYETTLDLANDLRCYLAGEPIRARASSRLYLLQRSLRRHRVMVAFATSILVLLSFFSVVTQRQAHASERLAASESAAHALAELDFQRALGAVDLLAELADRGLRDNPHAEGTRHELLTAALDFLRGILKGHPESPGLRGTQALTYYRIARLEYEIGRPERALEEVQRSIRDFELGLSAPASEQANLEIGLAGALTLLGTLENRSGNAKSAEDSLRSALSRVSSVLERGAAIGALWESTHTQFGQTHKQLAICLRAQARSEEALDGLRHAIELLSQETEQRASRSPSVELVGLLDQSCVIRIELKIHEGLELDLLQGIGLAVEWVRSAPLGPSAQKTLISLRTNYGSFLTTQGRVLEASEQQALALVTGESLASDHPALTGVRDALFAAYHNHANSLLLLQDLVAAESDLKRARDLLLELIDENPSLLRRGRLALLESTQAALLIALGSYPEAIVALEQTIGHARSLLKVAPGSTEFGSILRIAVINSALCRVALGEHARGIEMLEEMGLGTTGYETTFNVISALKIYRDAVSGAENDLDLDPEMRTEVAEYYADAATEYLSKARALGFVGLEQELEAIDWRSLGQHTVFADGLSLR